MATVKLTKDNFDEIIQNNDMVIIDFWAPWCGPCKNFGPIFEEISEKSEEYPNIVFAKVNTEEERDLAGQFQIRSIPTLAIFKENIMIFSQAGAPPQSAFEDLIKQAQKIDMETVRQKIAEEQQAKSEQATA
ncbi:MAG TPA: thioredoxin [Gammaproteobacteria bacterium]|nr:thioredoxin [Candidatus Parabeggiatoa sp.]HAI69451.1 thioredoxin [Gammaproteobacteria bacterium]